MQHATAEVGIRDAFSFAWNRLPSILWSYLWLYVLIVALSGIVSACGSTPEHLFILPFTWVAAFPALATATRTVVPNSRMNIRIVGQILAVQFGGAAALWLAIGAMLLVTRPGSGALDPMWLFILLPGLLILASWVAVKIVIAPAAYLLRRKEAFTVMGGVRLSWGAIRGRVWWSVVGVTLTIGFVCAVPAAIVSSITFKTFGLDYTAQAAFFASAILTGCGVFGVVLVQSTLAVYAAHLIKTCQLIWADGG